MSEKVFHYKNPEFDNFAENYDEAINQGLAVSGEKKEFFAQGRIELLKARLKELNFAPRVVLDFGCGTGAAIPFLRQLNGVETIYGAEVSVKSIEVAAKLNPFPEVRFGLIKDFPPGVKVDLVFCNGVFHHIPPDDRDEAVRFIAKVLRPGGLFCLWENNPWNPGTRYIMRKIPFDKEAIPLPPPETVALLKRNQFEILERDFAFYFPASLKVFRFMEPWLRKVPLGAQYCVLGRKG